MITGIEIHSFKRFRNQAFDLAPLTVLAGLNGSGKTTLIHSLLMAREASSNSSENTVRLNGPFGMNLGIAEDVRNWNSEEPIRLVVTSESEENSIWEFDIPSDDALYLAIRTRPAAPPSIFTARTRSFSYICAERFGPRNVLGASPLPADEIEVGVRGEYCAQLLAADGSKPMSDRSRRHPNRDANAPSLLKYEVEYWLGEIARPVEIDAGMHVGSTVTALRFRSSGGEWVRAPNMGFGVSYSLPIILAGLTSMAGGLIVVENPEAHLHPAGQSRMGVFLAWLAGRGIQVVLETHSDHILNGIRRAIGEHNYLAHSDAVVQFFDSTESDVPVVNRLDFTASGSISHWPRGFFDQYQVDVATLGRIRRRS